MDKQKDRVLSAAELRDGYQAALRQAADLLTESELLQSHQRAASAFHRLVIALEELGKARLIFYKAALWLGGVKSDWRRFWKCYYSHVEKLETALTWLRLAEVLSMDTVEAIADAKSAVLKYAERLDKAKQDSSYSRLTADGFAAPSQDAYHAEVAALAPQVRQLMQLAMRGVLATATQPEFEAEVVRLFRYAVATGYAGSSDLDQKIVRTNQSAVWIAADELPTDQAFIERVAERYSILPGLLGVTLPQLRRDPTFREFYELYLKARCGYPDWIILATIFNISLNARNREIIESGDPRRLEALGEWGEDPDVHGSLDVALFTDPDTFEQVLGVWLCSFLAGLGIAVEDAGEYGGNARRISARLYGVFNRDIEHEPMMPSIDPGA